MSDASGAAAFAEGIASAAASPRWEHTLQHPIFLGDAAFVERMQALVTPADLSTRKVPRPQGSRPLSLAKCLTNCPTRGKAFRQAHTCGGMSMSAIAAARGLSVDRVNQLTGRAEMDYRFKTRPSSLLVSTLRLGEHGVARHGLLHRHPRIGSRDRQARQDAEALGPARAGRAAAKRHRHGAQQRAARGFAVLQSWICGRPSEPVPLATLDGAHGLPGRGRNFEVRSRLAIA